MSKKSSYWKRFSEWQNYVHYLLLDTIISFVAYKFNAPIDLKMFGILYLTIFIGDSLIHGLFWILPKQIKIFGKNIKFRWRD